MSLLATLVWCHGAAALVVAVTHAAGRMGVSVIGQLREQWPVLGDDDAEALQLRAIIKSKTQADRLRLDLCGAVLGQGEFIPILDLEKDLGVELHVANDDVDEASSLEAAFQGADVAVLLSAAHADFGSPPTSAMGESADATTPRPRSTFHERAKDAYATALAQATEGLSVRVPPLAGASAARRLAAEIAAATKAPKLQHVVLRSW